MKPNPAYPTLALCLAILVAAPACDRSPSHASSTVAAEARPTHAPTEARLVERVKERWGKIVKDDWIAAFEYLSPETKRQGLSKYLQNKQNHKYENLRVGEVVQVDGKHGYLQVFTLWTPVHERIKGVELPAGQSLTQDVEMLESWRWAEGDWTYVRGQRPEEFYKDHPELLRVAKAGTPAPGK